MPLLPLLPLAPLLALALPAAAPAPPCGSAPLPPRSSSTAATATVQFLPGEHLGYELTVAGVHAGKMEYTVGYAKPAGGTTLLPLTARASTSTLFANFRRYRGQATSFYDLAAARPMRLSYEAEVNGAARADKAVFTGGGRSVLAEFQVDGKKQTLSYTSAGPLLDMVSIAYYARTRSLAPGGRACHDLYSDRRIWRLEATIAGVEDIETVAGKRSSIAIDLTISRLLVPAVLAKPFPLRVWLANDGDQVPLRILFKTRRGDAEARLVDWVKGG